MATWVIHECDYCDYSFVGSGKPDALFRGYTLPVVCSKCDEIYDRIIHSPTGEKLDGKCEECGSKKYTEWDYESNIKKTQKTINHLEYKIQKSLKIKSKIFKISRNDFDKRIKQVRII